MRQQTNFITVNQLLAAKNSVIPSTTWFLSLWMSKSSGSLSLKIVTASLDAFPVPHGQLIEAVLVLRQWDVPQCATHCCLDVLQVLESVAMNFGLQKWKRPVVTWGEVRTVLGVGPQPLCHVHLEEISCCVDACVREGIILK